MVTISGYFIRVSKLTQKPFVVLELLGEPEMIQSLATGKFYISSKKCTLGCTYSEDVAKTLIGKQLPGRIDRVEVEPYEYANPITGEVTILNHTYQYAREEATQIATLEKSVLA